MNLSPQVVAALVAALMSIVVTVGMQYWNLKRQGLKQQSEEERDYLNPLATWTSTLLAYYRKLKERIESEVPGAVRADFCQVKDQRGRAEFQRNCHDYLANAVGTLRATACYFAYAAQLLKDLSVLKLSEQERLQLREATLACREALARGGMGGFWPELQDCIAERITVGRGQVMSYSQFCAALDTDGDSFFRLLNFYVDIEMKKDHQLAWGLAALEQLDALLQELLHRRQAAGGPRRWRRSPAQLRVDAAPIEPSSRATAHAPAV